MDKVRVSVLKPRISGTRVRGYDTVAVNLTISEAILECHKHEATYAMAERHPCKLKREKTGNKTGNQPCRNCLHPQDGSVRFEDDLCENCFEEREYAKVLDNDWRQSGDFDFSMNH